jgi:hypothetical protein
MPVFARLLPVNANQWAGQLQLKLQVTSNASGWSSLCNCTSRYTFPTELIRHFNCSRLGSWPRPPAKKGHLASGLPGVYIPAVSENFETQPWLRESLAKLPINYRCKDRMPVRAGRASTPCARPSAAGHLGPRTTPSRISRLWPRRCTFSPMSRSTSRRLRFSWRWPQLSSARERGQPLRAGHCG